MSDIELSIVLPSYGEAENLKYLVPDLKREAQRLTDRWEIIVVDAAAAQDETPQLCARMQVVCVARSPSNGYGDAIRTGIRTARGKWVVIMDADGSHPPRFVASLFAHASTHDLVIASRYAAGGQTENSLALVLMSRLLNLIYSWAFGLPCKDVSNSFRLYRGDLLRGLDLDCQNFDIVEEMLIKFAQRGAGLRVKEVPFTFKRRAAGKTKRSPLRFIASYLGTLVRLRVEMWRKRRPPVPAPVTLQTHPPNWAGSRSTMSVSRTCRSVPMPRPPKSI